MKQLLEYMRKSLPKYTTIQPSTGKQITYTPFTVKEEKNLLISSNTGNREDFLSTIGDIIDNCFTLEGKTLNIPIFDIEYFFIKLRCKSVGEIIQTVIICPETSEKININLNLEEIEPIFYDNHSKQIKFDNMIINLRYPNLKDFIEKKDTEDYYDMLLKCIETIQTPNELIETNSCSIEQLKEFIDLLTKPQFNKLIEFFKTMPKIQKEIEYKTSDGVSRKVILRGIRDFFQ